MGEVIDEGVASLMVPILWSNSMMQGAYLLLQSLQGWSLYLFLIVPQRVAGVEPVRARVLSLWQWTHTTSHLAISSIVSRLLRLVLDAMVNSLISSGLWSHSSWSEWSPMFPQSWQPMESLMLAIHVAVSLSRVLFFSGALRLSAEALA